MDMVEKVARAIWDERCRHWGKYRKDLHEPNSEGYDWDDLGLSKRKELLREARAAIAAMRDMEVVFRENGEAVTEIRGAPADVWLVLLDAALTSSEPQAPSSE